MASIYTVQLIAGLFSLLNKIFMSISERTKKNINLKKNKWRMWAWIVYLISLPPWIIIFYMERNWIAMALEAGGTPSMILGLIISIKGEGKEPKWLHVLAILSIITGLSYSIYDFHGLRTLNQGFELTLVTGYLIGTFQLAKEKLYGYIWYVLMHISCAILMLRQDHIFLSFQQVISLVFVIDAFYVKRTALKKQII